MLDRWVFVMCLRRSRALETETHNFVCEENTLGLSLKRHRVFVVWDFNNTGLSLQE
jgi:hypothetical protein